MSTWSIIGILIGVAIWLFIFIKIWINGTEQQSKPMVIIGGFFTLWWIGLIIVMVQIISWDVGTRHTEKLFLEKERFDLEKQKLALEKERLEFEKQKNN